MNKIKINDKVKWAGVNDIFPQIPQNYIFTVNELTSTGKFASLLKINNEFGIFTDTLSRNEDNIVWVSVNFLEKVSTVENIKNTFKSIFK